MQSTAENTARRSPATVTVKTTLYDFIDVVGGEFAGEDRLLAKVVTHLMETGQLRVAGNRRRLRRMLREF